MTLLPHHLDDLRRSGLTDETIDTLGFYSGTADQVASILGFNAGPGLIFPYPVHGGGMPLARVKPDAPPVIEGRAAKYLSPRGGGLRAYIPPRSWQALQETSTRVIFRQSVWAGFGAFATGSMFSCQTSRRSHGMAGMFTFFQTRTLPQIPKFGMLSGIWGQRFSWLLPMGGKG